MREKGWEERKEEEKTDLTEAGVRFITENVFGVSVDCLIVAPLFPQKCAVVAGFSVRL